MPALKRLKIQGLKSIREMDLVLSDLNILIGPNGAGKSNFLWFFRMLNSLSEGKFQLFVGHEGGANSLLHHGRRRTPQLHATMSLDVQNGANTYSMTFGGVAPNDLMFVEEEVVHHPMRGRERPSLLGGGHRESRLPEAIEQGNKTAQTIKWSVDRFRVFHFHDTSPESAIKQNCQTADNRFLRANGANLAAFLYMLKEVHQPHYLQIRDTVRLVAPFFDDFVLEPDALNPAYISLGWREKEEEGPFFAHHFSDGTLRFIALTTVLNQPPNLSSHPHLILIDEPELGLHPYAITLLASMIRAASKSVQIVLSTQSLSLLDELAEPSEVVVVERADRQSVFRRLDETALESWLERYSLGELGEKSALGGLP